MKVLIGCETSGTVRDAFLERGHDAWSCDVLPSDTPTNRHIQDDIRNVMQDDWDLLMVAHPPCTRLAKSEDSGDNAKKRTCLWLKNLPKLNRTGSLDGSTARDECHKLPPSANRWKLRSKFYKGIADAMAMQWGALA